MEGGIIIDAGIEIGKNSMVENDILAENTLFDKKIQQQGTATIANGGA